MCTAVDRIFSWLLVLGGILHGVGTFKAYEIGSSVFVWSIAASFAAILLVITLGRPVDSKSQTRRGESL